VPAGTYKLLIQLPSSRCPPRSRSRIRPARRPRRSSRGRVERDAGEGDGQGHGAVRQRQAPKGPFEIVLTRQGEELAGKWSYGGDTGKLTGKVE
jgi:hypothetical protein